MHRKFSSSYILLQPHSKSGSFISVSLFFLCFMFSFLACLPFGHLTFFYIHFDTESNVYTKCFLVVVLWPNTEPPSHSMKHFGIRGTIVILCEVHSWSNLMQKINKVKRKRKKTYTFAEDNIQSGFKEW